MDNLHNFIEKRVKIAKGMILRLSNLDRECDGHKIQENIDEILNYLIYQLESEKRIVNRLDWSREIDHKDIINDYMKSIVSYINDGILQPIINCLSSWLESNQNILKGVIPDLEIDELLREAVEQGQHGLIQVVFFEKGYFLVAYGTINGDILDEFQEKLKEVIESNYIHEDGWFSVTDLRWWQYATKEAYEKANRISKGHIEKHKTTFLYIIKNDNLSEFIARQIPPEGQVIIKYYDTLLPSINYLIDQFGGLGKVISIESFGSMYYGDQHFQEK